MMRMRAAVAAVGLALLLVGCAPAVQHESEAQPAAVPTATVAPNAAASIAAGALQDPLLGEVIGRSERTPTRVSIPSIGVDSTLERLSRDDTGWIQPPVIVDEAGWYQDGVVPGDLGPAVIAGHVDSRIGPGVFLDLAALAVGSAVSVALSDGTSVDFTVTKTISVPKEQFPTDDVYGPTPTAQLRLITCGGVFDDAYGHYVDNVVVYAVAAG